MVIQSLNGIYLHCAWATSDRGDDFSLVEFADATYCGTYSDNSSTESTEPRSYNWMLIGDISGADNGTDEAINVENATILANQQANNAQAQTIVNNDNIQASQDDTDMSTGNPNELIGTNQGTNNWTASAGLTISAQSGTIYNDTADVINYLHVVCNTAGSNYIAFDASALRDKLAELTDDNSFTLSADINMSTVFEMPVMVSDDDGTNIQIDFGTIEPELIPVPEETADGLWVFNKSTANCGNEVAVSSQVVLFDLSNMGAGETLDIANLKIEGGALATPWRASLDEVANIANQAYSVANNTEQHFWFQSTGLDTGAHITEVDKDTWDLDPSNGGGNLLARSNGVAVRDGLNELATFYVDQLGRTVLDLLENNHGRITALYAGSNLDDTTISFYARNENGDKASLDLTAWENSPAVGIQAGSKTIRANINGIYLEGGDVYIGANKLTDYVISRGTSGNWKYIKWASGRVECEGWYTFSSLTFSQRGSSYRSSATAFTIPSGIFSSTPTECHGWIQASSASDYFGVVLNATSTTGGNCMVWKATSGNATNVAVHMRFVYRG
jgi:hypothetical protein